MKKQLEKIARDRALDKVRMNVTRRGMKIGEVKVPREFAEEGSGGQHELDLGPEAEQKRVE